VPNFISVLISRGGRGSRHANLCEKLQGVKQLLAGIILLTILTGEERLFLLWQVPGNLHPTYLFRRGGSVNTASYHGMNDKQHIKINHFFYTI
jgi:hypothetical protein